MLQVGLHTLGTLQLQNFKRVKPLLVLAFVSLEGPTPRRRVAELLWAGAEQTDSHLRTALYRLRQLGELFDCEEPLQTAFPCDAVNLLEQRGLSALQAYSGPFLQGASLSGVSAEFEEWVLEQRERLARHVQSETLSYAEGCDPAQAAHLTETAYRLPGAAPGDPPLLRRMLALTIPGSALENELKQELASFAPDLPSPASAPAKHQKTRMLGRSAELDTLLAWAVTPGGGTALVSGPGGIGKSTLGRELLRELKVLGHHVIHVDAEGVTHASQLIARTIAQSGATRSAADTWAGVGKLLGERPVILLDGVDSLDNLSDLLQELTRTLPQVRWVLTGRRSRLGLPPRQGSLQRGLLRQHDGTPALSLRLSGLDVPAPDAELAEVPESAAVQLLIREGQRVRRDFALTPENAPLLVSLTRRLQGHPLALALAASWLRVEGLADVHARVLEQAATLEDANTPGRGLVLVAQRSWELLSADQQAALLRLSVCADFEPTDAIALDVPESALNALLEHSFLETFRPGSERLRICPALESIAQTYGPQHPELIAQAREQHAQHYLNWFTSLPPTAPPIAAERENLRLALHTALRGGWLAPEPLYHLMSHYDALAMPASGTDVFQDLCDLTEQVNAPNDVKAAAQIACMWLAQRADRLQDSQILAERFLAGPLAEDPQHRMKALNTLAVVYKEKGDFGKAANVTRKALRTARGVSDILRQAIFAENLIDYLIKFGDMLKARETMEKYQALINEVGWLNMKINLVWYRLDLPNPDYESEIENLDILLKEAIIQNSPLDQFAIYACMSSAHLGLNQPNKTLNDARNLISVLEKSESAKWRCYAYILEADALHKLGHSSEARVAARNSLNLALQEGMAMYVLEGIISSSQCLFQNHPEEIRDYLGNIFHNPQLRFAQKVKIRSIIEDVPFVMSDKLLSSEEIAKCILKKL